MRVLVIGSSSSAGTGLADQSLAWPWLLKAELPAIVGEPVDLEHRIVFPVGPRALPLAFLAVDETEPDLVIHSFGCFPCIIGTVGTRVRKRYGARAFRAFRKFNLLFEGNTARTDGRPARLNHVGRWLVRHVIGTETLATYDEVFGVHSTIQHRLSQREGILLVSMCEPDLSGRLVKENRGALAILRRFRNEMEAVARGHRFIVADCGDGFDAHPERESLFLSDGLHKSVAGQRIQADAILTAIRASGLFAASAAGASVLR